MKQPTIYEINTPVFLNETSQRLGYPVTLTNVPDEIWDEIVGYGVDTVWFMGVWRRSEVARRMAYEENWLRQALPGVENKDIIGSAYSVREYSVDESLGGNEGLAIARAQLKERGISIFLDYVPNHIAIDHAWVAEHPEYLIPGTTKDPTTSPRAFLTTPRGIIARGKDPNFEPWSDVLQINAFSDQLRQAATEVLKSIASMCDGVRCDMAMLMMNDVFKKTWGARAGKRPHSEYWPAIIASVKEQNPQFLFLAEVYWGKEKALVKQGFDFCYDKGFYDDLLQGSVESLKNRLRQPSDWQKHLMRFIENHDEERAAKAFPVEKYKAAALIASTLPGMRLFYQGQFEGARIKLPVHFSRRKQELVDVAMSDFYRALFHFMKEINFTTDKWKMIPARSGFFGREFNGVLAWSWTSWDGKRVIVVNYSPDPAEARLPSLHPKKVRRVRNLAGDAVEVLDKSTVQLDAWQSIIIDLF